VVVVLIVVVIAVVGVAGTVIFLSGSTALGSIPTYPGATDSGINFEQILGGTSMPAGCSGKMCYTTASPENVVNWYETQMSGWTKVVENTISGAAVLSYTKGTDTAIIVAAENSSQNVILIIVGPTSSLEGVANSIIATYVSGLYVPSTSIRVMSCVGATVYDYDSTGQNENYKNGNISIILRVETGSFRSIADPAYGGTTVTVANPLTGWTGSVSFPDNTDKWGTTLSATENEGTSMDPDGVLMTVTMSPDEVGRLTAGSSITILLQPYGTTDAHTNAARRMSGTKLWDEADSLTIAFTNRDSASFSGYDGYLYGSSWVA
jgi:hypothetical protein